MLEINSLVKSYNDFELGPLDLTVRNEVLAILGPSGCGKTTLLSTIAGISPIDEGNIRLNDHHINDLEPEERDAAMLFQDGALFPHMTARENITYAVHTADSVSVDNLATRLEIRDVLNKEPDALSGGQKQRVALARALAAEPEVLLLDEPFANLDTPIKRRLRSELGGFLSSLSIPVIYVTHDQRTASIIGDRIAVMEDGFLHQVGSPTEVFEKPASPFVATFTGNENLFRARIPNQSPEGELVWQGYRLTVNGELKTTSDVWFCIRPEQVRILRDSETTTENVVPGQIIDSVFTGDSYRLTVRLDQASNELIVNLSPGQYDQLELTDRFSVRLLLPKQHIHTLNPKAEDVPKSL